MNVVVAPGVPAPPVLDEEQMRELQSLSNGNAGLSQEELRAIMQRAAEARRRAIQQQRMNERDRRRQRTAPLPPPQP